MFKKAKQARDAFAFSLGGMRTAPPFFAPAIADDRINRIRDAQMALQKARRAQAERGDERPTHVDPKWRTQSA